MNVLNWFGIKQTLTIVAAFTDKTGGVSVSNRRLVNTLERLGKAKPEAVKAALCREKSQAAVLSRIEHAQNGLGFWCDDMENLAKQRSATE